MEELLKHSVRELESMKMMAIDMAEKESSSEVNIEDIIKHFDEVIQIKKEEFWSGLASCNESLAQAESESAHDTAYQVLKQYLDNNVLFFSEGSEDFEKFQYIYESFYSALNEMEGEVSEEAIEEAISAMLEDIKKLENHEDIMQLKNAVNNLADLRVRQILLEAIEKRESEL